PPGHSATAAFTPETAARRRSSRSRAWPATASRAGARPGWVRRTAPSPLRYRGRARGPQRLGSRHPGEHLLEPHLHRLAVLKLGEAMRERGREPAEVLLGPELARQRGHLHGLDPAGDDPLERL